MDHLKSFRANASTLLSSSVALSMLVLPASNFAQSVKTGEASTELEEIVVTAQKRVESAQQIPKAVEVLSETALARAGVTNLQDLKLISPSIQGTANSGSPPAIRGISSFAFSIGVQAQTGVVLDDVPQPTFSTLADELSDVVRVEVLPGPQSTLSGRNAAGGLINIVTRKPSKTLEANVTAELTDDHQQRIAGYVTGPLSDTFGFSVSGFSNDWDGPLRNLATNNRLGGYDRSGARAKLEFEPSDRFNALLTAYYVRNKAPTVALAGGYPYVYLADDAASYFFPVPLKGILQGHAGPYNTYLNSATEDELRSEDKGASLYLNFDTSLGSISSISNVSRSETKTVTPLAAFSVFNGIKVQQDYDVDYKTQEFRLASPKDNGRFEYLLGLIYSDTNVFEPYERTVIAPVNWDRTVDMKSTAFYGRGTYALMPQTFLTTGVRFQYDSQSYDWVFKDGSAASSSGSSTYNFASGEISLRQELTPDASVYFTYANAQTGRAYDLEDAASASTAPGLQPLDSERVQSLEFGIKSQWLDRRLTLNASVFDQRYRNYQIQSAYQLTPQSLPTIRLLSIGRVEARGVEVSGSFAATPDWNLNLAATVLDAKIRDYPGAACYTGQTVPAACANAAPGTQGFQGNLAGTTMPGASKFKGVLSTAYTLRLPSSLTFDGIFNAFYRYQSSTHYDVLNDPVSYQNGFGIVNVAAGIQGRDKNYSVQLFVNNLLDKKNYASLARDTVVASANNPAAVYGTYGRDWHRYAGVRLNVKF